MSTLILAIILHLSILRPATAQDIAGQIPVPAIAWHLAGEAHPEKLEGYPIGEASLGSLLLTLRGVDENGHPLDDCCQE